MTKKGKCSECRAYLAPSLFKTPYGSVYADELCNCQKSTQSYQAYLPQYNDSESDREYLSCSNGEFGFYEDF